MNRIFAYFDLNNRQAITPFSRQTLPPPESILVEVESESGVEAVAIGARRRRRPVHGMAGWEQWVFYAGTVGGVIVSPWITQYQAGKSITPSITLATGIVAAFVGLMLMPYIEKKGIKDDSPFIVRLGLFVQAGIFWSLIFTSIGKAYG